MEIQTQSPYQDSKYAQPYFIDLEYTEFVPLSDMIRDSEQPVMPQRSAQPLRQYDSEIPLMHVQ